MSLVMSIIIAVVIAGIAMAAGVATSSDEVFVREEVKTIGKYSHQKTRLNTSEIGPVHWIQAIVLGLVSGAICYLSTLVEEGTVEPAWLIYVMAGVSVLIYVYLIIWWCHPEYGGADGAGFFWFFVLGACALAPLVVSLQTAINMTESEVWQRIFVAVNWIAPVTLFTSMGINLICYEKKLIEDRDEEDIDARAERKWNNLRWGSRVLHTAFILFLVLLIIFEILVPVLRNPGASTEDTPASYTDADTDVGAAAVPTVRWPQSYNKLMLYDNDPGNDYNFGDDRYVEGWTEKDYLEDMLGSDAWDVSMGVVHLGYSDLMIGTGYSGIDDLQDVKSWNERAAYFAAHHEEYDTQCKNFAEFLESAKRIWVEHRSGITDQVFMNPYVATDYSEIVVMTSAEREGDFLCFEFEFKGKTVVLAFRINCRYQPVNVEKLGLKPTTNSTTPPATTTPPRETTPPDTTTTETQPDSRAPESGTVSRENTRSPDSLTVTRTGGGGGGGNGGGGGGGNTTPDGQGAKVITAGSNPGDNDSRGVENDPYTGSSTGWSTADDGNHSSHQTDEDVQASEDNHAYANVVTSEERDNTADYTPPAGTTVDNAGDNGTADNGYIGINETTQVASPDTVNGGDQMQGTTQGDANTGEFNPANLEGN